MKTIVKKLIPFVAALLLLAVCGTLSEAPAADREGPAGRADTRCTKISAGSGSPDDIPLD